MREKNIQDAWFGYDLIRIGIKFVYPKFFREVEIRGSENLPENEPLIFAGNHQCGLMDPLAVIQYQKHPIVYMARADIFKSKLNRILLRYIKVSPIYRIRDGYENLAKNEQQMKEAIGVLLDRKQLGLMPEGNHGKDHKLRPLVKGLFRIGYSAEILLENRAHVKIIPVGIDYSHYQHAGSDLVVTYGEPIELKDFLPLYLENQAVGLNVLRNELTTALSGLMHDIRSADYDRTYHLCCYGVPAFLENQIEKGLGMNASTIAGLRFDARVALGKRFDRMELENPDSMATLGDLCQRLNQLPGYPNEITEWMEEKPSLPYSILLGVTALALSPGMLLNLPAWSLTHLILSKVEDKQMHSTFAFTMGMFFNFIVYLLMTLIIGHFMDANLLLGLILFVMLTTLGVVSERGRQSFRMPLKKIPYAFGKRKVFLSECKKDYLELKRRIKNLL
jgi:1-acyl-sn-glycerol-3-phosphate acyltransferase